MTMWNDKNKMVEEKATQYPLDINNDPPLDLEKSKMKETFDDWYDMKIKDFEYNGQYHIILNTENVKIYDGDEEPLPLVYFSETEEETGILDGIEVDANNKRNSKRPADNSDIINVSEAKIVKKGN